MILAALLLAAAPQPAPTPAWLIGRWVPVSDAARQDAEACASDDVKLWRGDGSFSDAAGDGDWSLRAGRLIEIGETGTHAGRVERLGPDRLRLTDADGEQIDYWRCRRPR